MKAGVFQPSARHIELIGKMRSETGSDEEIAEFARLHRQRSCDILEAPLEQLFKVSATHVSIPEKAHIEQSKVCDLCGEPAMGSKMTNVKDQLICRDCVGTHTNSASAQ